MAKYEKYIVLLAVVMINGTLSVTFFFGNLSTYIYSLQFNGKTSSSFDIDVSWVLAVYMLMKPVNSFIVQYSVHFIGLRLTMAWGVLFSIASVLLTYFTVTHSVWATAITLTFIGSLGNNTILMCNLIYVAGWFASGVGLATSMPFSASAVGGIIMNQIITSFINPNNLSPDSVQDGIPFFSQPEISDRVPGVFLVMGSVTAVGQIIGFCLLKQPPVGIARPEGGGGATDESHFLLEGGKSRANGQDNRNDASFQRFYTSEKDEISSGHCFNDNMTFSMSKNNLSEDVDKRKLTISCSHEVILTGVVSVPQEINYTPIQLFKSASFYVLGFVVFAQSIAFIVIVNYYKVFGQLWIDDDQFLATVGSFISFSTIPFCMLSGYLVDRFGVKNSVSSYLALTCVFYSFVFFTARASRWLYLVWLMLLYGLQYEPMVMIPLATLKMFGGQHYASNYGLIQLSSLAAYFIGPPLATFLLDSLGWFWLFASIALLCVFSMLPVLLKMK